MDQARIKSICDKICTEYCRYPYIWDEEKEGIPLSESSICKNCPLDELEGAGEAE